MSLRFIPYYPSLKDLDLPGGVQPIDIILFGAIIFYSTGPLDRCVAKIETLAEETGYSISEIKNRRSRLITAGWITKETNEYGKIISVSPAMSYDSTSGAWTPFSQMTEGGSVKRLKGVQSNDGTLTPEATPVGKMILNNDSQQRAEAEEESRPPTPSLVSPTSVASEPEGSVSASANERMDVLVFVPGRKHKVRGRITVAEAERLEGVGSEEPAIVELYSGGRKVPRQLRVSKRMYIDIIYPEDLEEPTEPVVEEPKDDGPPVHVEIENSNGDDFPYVLSQQQFKQLKKSVEDNKPIVFTTKRYARVTGSIQEAGTLCRFNAWNFKRQVR